jgi:Resolvase, N terminal domain
LAERARQLGFHEVVVIDEDLGRSGSGVQERPGFGRLLAAVCQGLAGAVVALETSRLARNNRDSGKPHLGKRTDSSRGVAGTAGGRMRAVGHRRESPGISRCESGDSRSAQRKEISANCRWTSRVAFKIKDIEQVVIMSKHCSVHVNVQPTGLRE